MPLSLVLIDSSGCRIDERYWILSDAHAAMDMLHDYPTAHLAVVQIEANKMS